MPWTCAWEYIKGELITVDKDVETSRDNTTLNYEEEVSKHLVIWWNLIWIFHMFGCEYTKTKTTRSDIQMEEPLLKGRIRQNETRFCQPSGKNKNGEEKKSKKYSCLKREEEIIAAEKQKL